MPVSISVGDIFAGIEFLTSISDALASSTGSKAQYQGVLATLKSLESALNEFSTLDATDHERRLAKELIDRIKETVSRFHAKVSKYDATLASNSTAKWWRTLPRKIQWQRYSKDDISAFHDELLRHASALQIHLAKIQNTAGSKQREQIANVCSSLKAHIDQQRATLGMQLDETKAFISNRVATCEATTVQALERFDRASQTRTAEIKVDSAASAESVRLTIRQHYDSAELSADRRQQECTTLVRTEFAEAERAAQLRTQNIVAELTEMKAIIFVFLVQWARLIQNVLTSLPPRMLTQASTIFEDAAWTHLPHRHTIHPELALQSFQFVLNDNFTNKPGHERIKNGAYLLFDRFDRRPINQKKAFQAVFRPGRHIRQSVIFEQGEITTQNCPKCDYENVSDPGAEVKCARCKLYYRHEEDIYSADVNGDVQQQAGSTPVESPQSKTSPESPPTDHPSDFARIVIEPSRYWCNTCNTMVAEKLWMRYHWEHALSPDPLKRLTSAKVTNHPIWYCLYEHCHSRNLRFTRKADLERHVDATHIHYASARFDCEVEGCRRRGDQGFARKDKMLAHMQQFHGWDVTKPQGGGLKLNHRSARPNERKGGTRDAGL